MTPTEVCSKHLDSLVDNKIVDQVQSESKEEPVPVNEYISARDNNGSKHDEDEIL